MQIDIALYRSNNLYTLESVPCTVSCSLCIYATYGRCDVSLFGSLQFFGCLIELCIEL